jgi:hypothetical protein
MSQEKLSGLRAVLVMNEQGCFSQVLRGAKDFQYEKGCEEIATDQCPETTLTVEDTDQLVTLR